MRGLIVDYFGVLDGTEEDRDQWRAVFAGARENDVDLAILSNEPQGPGAEKVRRDAEWFGVGTVVLSGDTGVEKPDPQAYRIAAERLDLDPKECVFVDDAIENVHAAVQVGMIGVFYQVFDRSAVEIRGLLGLRGTA